MRWDNWRLIAVLSISGFVGLLFDQMMAMMFVAVLIYALWLQRSWNQLYRWVRSPKTTKAPSAEGVVDDVCREIERVRKQNRDRKKKLAGYLKRFQATTAALPDAVVVLGDDSLVIWSNKAAESLLGLVWPRDSHVRLKNVIRTPEFQTILAAPIEEEHQIVVTSPRNADIRLELKVVRYMTSGRLLIARDITKTLKLQQMRRDFVANVSHELRTPLTVLRGYLETFNQDSPVDMWGAALPTMQEQTERMHVMITDLLALSHLETGEKELNYEPIEMNGLLNSIVEDAKKIEQFDGHDLQLTINSELHLHADRDELRSAVSNLVFNAVKYTAAKTTVTISWAVDNQGGHITVKDEGEGIDEHHLERLTERFYRVDKGRAQEAGGTGLGLAIVKHVLNRHEAELTITSALGEGSEFSCDFPVNRLTIRD
ncbi:phosphate regulon sensor histidine kinase PhoR [Methylophaga sp. 42_25_T18]|nr:phosphate regulon sensor histidine kinase PhoR [Methylophaga sp. 42_25_T18]OUR87178.1 phosphate regulon sensor histidine kinase PhoR [Methylophaga sp. 42_8_T64]